jgi:hypothetical protein
MIKKYTIYGERCSGTNYLEQLMLANFDIEITWDYGWKHFFGFSDLSNTDDILFIGIIRNLCDWVNSLYREKHHLRENKELIKNVDTFLNNPFYSINDNGNEIMEDRHIETQKRYKNIFELRQIKNNFLLEKMPLLVKNYCVITYDSLLDNFENIMNKIKNYGLVVKNNINFPVNINYYKNNNEIIYKKKINTINDEIILNKADLFYEKILFSNFNFNAKIVIYINQKNINNSQKINEIFCKKILNINKDRNIDVEINIKKQLLNDEILLLYYSWKNGYLFKNQKLPKNIKNIILKKI